MSADIREYPPIVSSKFFPEGLDRGVYELIAGNIAKQKILEDSLIFDEKDHAFVSEDLRFVLGTQVARLAAHHCYNFMRELRERETPLKLLDVGGGTGTFIAQLQALLPYVEIQGTVLSLTDFFSKLGKPVPAGVTLRQLSAEFPDDDMYQAYDMVTQFSGPLQWSQHPQIVASNMINMVRPGGFMFYQANPNYHGVPYQFNDTRLGFSCPVVVTASDINSAVILYKYQELKE